MNESTDLVAAMADRFQLQPDEFKRTIKSICFPKGQASDEQLFAFLAIARKHDLDPFTREIFAMVRPDSGIQVIVSVDGWMKIINSHPQFDGLEFSDKVEGGKLLAITCRIYRKDRKHPTECTEYLRECTRNTEPWQKWPARMLRHKAAIQCARYAFSFAGIVDPDESQRIEAIDITDGELSEDERPRAVKSGASPGTGDEGGTSKTPPPSPAPKLVLTPDDEPSIGAHGASGEPTTGVLPPDETRPDASDRQITQEEAQMLAEQAKRMGLSIAVKDKLFAQFNVESYEFLMASQLMAFAAAMKAAGARQ